MKTSSLPHMIEIAKISIKCRELHIYKRNPNKNVSKNMMFSKKLYILKWKSTKKKLTTEKIILHSLHENVLLSNFDK